MSHEQTELRELLADAAESAPQARAWAPSIGRPALRRRRRGQAVVSLTAVALLAAGVTAVSLSSSQGRDESRIVPAPAAAEPTHSAAITVNGKRVPFAGSVPWSDPVAAGPESTVVNVFADGDRAGGNLCGLPVERVSVVETASSVTVSVSGYGTPLPPGTGCAGVGHGTQLQRVTLKAPLGTRLLIDASDGGRHPVLDSRTVPEPTSVPAGFAAQPLRWDEKSGFASRTYLGGSESQPQSIFLGYGNYARGGDNEPEGQVIGSTTIEGTTSPIWHYSDNLNNDITTFQWTPGGAKTIRLIVSGSAQQHLSVEQATAIAKSVK